MSLISDATFADRDRVTPPDATSVPPRELLSPETAALLDERDRLYDEFCEAESDHYELIQPDYAKHFADLDEKAGREAAEHGANPLDIESQLQRAQVERPRVMGYIRGLAAKVNRADRALIAAVRAELSQIESALGEVMDKAADAYAKAQDKADAERAKYGAAVAGYDWVVGWSRLGLRGEFPRLAELTPRTADGQEPQDLHGRLVDRGRAEVKAVNASYGREV